MLMMSVAEQAAALDTIRTFIFSYVCRAATRLRFDPFSLGLSLDSRI
jgi:hypothetical protein